MAAKPGLGLQLQFQIDTLRQKTTAPTPAKPSERIAEYTELARLVEELKEAQKGTKSVIGVVGKKNFTAFNKWAKDNGIVSDKVEIATFAEQGNGLRATAPIAAGETALKVPLKCMLSTATAKDAKMGPFAAEDPMLSRMPNVLLAVHTLSELHKKASFWRPYLEVLPASFSTPLYYTSAEMALLKGSPVMEQSMALFKNVVRQYIYLLKQLKTPKVAKAVGISPAAFPFADYLWAVSAVMTRQNRVPVGGTDEAPEFALALIPLWDMLNHTTGAVTTQHDCATEETEFAAMQAVAAGDEVLMFYGGRTNAELLLHSGFVFEGNPHDYLLIKLGIGKSDPLNGLKSQLLHALTIPSSGEFTIGADGEPDGQLNAFIRINSMTEAELKGHLSNPALCGTLGDADGAVNEENEPKACLFLEQRCKLLLMGYRGGAGADGADGGTYHSVCATRLAAAEQAALKACAEKMSERGLEEDL